VIAPDLPGIGDSAIPADGLDMKNAAIRIHSLARSSLAARSDASEAAERSRSSAYSEPATVANNHFAQTQDEAVIVHITGFGRPIRAMLTPRTTRRPAA